MTQDEFDDMFEEVQRRQSPIATRQEHYVNGIKQTAPNNPVGTPEAEPPIPAGGE